MSHQDKAEWITSCLLALFLFGLLLFVGASPDTLLSLWVLSVLIWMAGEIRKIL